MFSALKFVAAGAILALFGGFLLVGVPTAPPESDSAPAAVGASPSLEDLALPHLVSGELRHDRTFDNGDVSWIEAARRQEHRDVGWKQLARFDDPRLDGTMWITLNLDSIGNVFFSHAPFVMSGTAELVNEQGSWIGTVDGYDHLEGGSSRFALSGTGAYEGFAALLFTEADLEGATGKLRAAKVDGFVFPGALPDYPDVVEPLAD